MALNRSMPPVGTATVPMSPGMETSAGTSQSSNSDPKSARILRQGAYQHALVSPGLAGLPFKNEDEFVAMVSRVAEKVIKLIEG